jgi:hypothetical protein
MLIVLALRLSRWRSERGKPEHVLRDGALIIAASSPPSRWRLPRLLGHVGARSRRRSNRVQGALSLQAQPYQPAQGFRLELHGDPAAGNRCSARSWLNTRMLEAEVAKAAFVPVATSAGAAPLLTRSALTALRVFSARMLRCGHPGLAIRSAPASSVCKLHCSAPTIATRSCDLSFWRDSLTQPTEGTPMDIIPLGPVAAELRHTIWMSRRTTRLR